MKDPPNSKTVPARAHASTPRPRTATQDVDAGAGDDQREHDADGVGEVEREEIADEGRHAERRRLPVEGERHPECAVGVPQREMAVVHLGPGQGRPRDHLPDLVPVPRVQDGHAPLTGNAVAGEQVVRAQPRTVHHRRGEDTAPGDHHPGQAHQVGPARRGALSPCSTLMSGVTQAWVSGRGVGPETEVTARAGLRHDQRSTQRESTGSGEREPRGEGVRPVVELDGMGPHRDARLEHDARQRQEGEGSAVDRPARQPGRSVRWSRRTRRLDAWVTSFQLAGPGRVTATGVDGASTPGRAPPTGVRSGWPSPLSGIR